MVIYSGIKLVFHDKPFTLIFDLFPFLRDNRCIQSLPKRLSCANIYKYINTDHVINTVGTNFSQNRSSSMFKFWNKKSRVFNRKNLQSLKWLKMFPKFNDDREIVYNFRPASMQSYISALNRSNLNPLKVNFHTWYIINTQYDLRRVLNFRSRITSKQFYYSNKCLKFFKWNLRTAKLD
jgi:hypothetical protein